MPFTDPVSSVSGRNSRASNISGATGTSRSKHRSPPTTSNDTMASAGVLSMLKTSTDTGDIGALSFNTSRLPGMPGAVRTRRGHRSKTSATAASAHPHMTSLSSNHSHAPSQNSRVSSQWDNASNHQRRGSLTSMQSMPPSLPALHAGRPPLQMMPPLNDDYSLDSRSYSMTSAPGGQLPRLRSAASLKSQGHEPRHANRMPPGPVPPMPENRPPFIYPTRLKRPGFRSPSPALSDTYSPGMAPIAPGMSRRHPGHQQPPVTGYGGYNAAYMTDYGPHLQVRPPPRATNNSPSLGFAQNQYAYQQMPMRPPPGPAMPPHMMQQPYPQQYNTPPQMPQRPAYSQQYPPMPGYAPYPQPPPQMSYRRPPPQAAAAPMAHQMFHNAARMARQVPQRTDTPMTDNGPPSSDPASASSAPDSSSPPTPRDYTTIQIAVDPAFINPDLDDLPDTSDDPVLPNAKYFAYADGLPTTPIDEEEEMEVPRPSVPPSGFVQRVKAMLESKAAAEAAVQHEHEKAMQLQQQPHHYLDIHELDVDRDLEEVSELADVHEMAANETPRFTIIEEFEAPVELPASPVKPAELDAIETIHTRTTHITKEMIRAELGGSSVDNTLQQAQPDESTADVLAHLVETGDPIGGRSAFVFEDPEKATKASGRSSRQSTSSTKHREDAVSGFNTDASLEGSLPTGAGYALRFSNNADTTVDSDETRTKDAFALDTSSMNADTITMQQQSAARETSSSEGAEDGRKTPALTINPSRQSHFLDMTPVSPLRPGEEVKRMSAVSPIQEDGRGLVETLLIGLDGARESTTDQSTFNSLAAEFDSMPPPTPRTVRTYSKSVQLARPSGAVLDSNGASTNRFSLPGDLSTVGDSSVNSGSDMITDVAVRFSLPGTTITIGKPHIIDVSTSSTPDRLKESMNLPNHTQQLVLRSNRRNSVTFAEDIAPLNIKKPAPPKSTDESTTAQGKSQGRRSPPREDMCDSTRSSVDSTTDLRFKLASHATGTHARFGSTHLPRLKEESVEDMSISDRRRSSGIDSFALPSRIAAVKAMQERRLQESADKAKARRAARKHNRPLADTRDLPSLNFSRTDLFEKLNEALDTRPVRSMDIVRRREFSTIYCPSPQRPMSTEPLRGRYTSFFSKPDEFTLDEDLVASSDDEEGDGMDTDLSVALVPTLQVQENTLIEGEEPSKRPLSPEDFMNVAAQASRLSIPSVAGLSDRLSELIPGLRNLHSLQLDVLLASDDGTPPGFTNHGTSRPETVLSNRTSAGFHTLAERAEEIVKNGTHDSSAPLFTKLALDKELPCLPVSASVDKLSGYNFVDGKASYLSGSVSAPIDLGKDPSRPPSALLRARAPTTMEEVHDMLPAEMNPITRMANKRSTIVSQPSSRPWNVDKNYPWSGSKIDIDLSVPSPAHTRKSFASEILRERRTRSLDLPATQTSKDGKDFDPMSINNSPQADSISLTTEYLTGITSHHGRAKSKRSLIGSITRKFGLSPRRNTDTEEYTTTKSLFKSPVPRQTSVMSHKPGDRYPTSSLTPPAVAALDEVRSFFSDNSSERDRTASFRKRLTNFKGKSKPRAADSTGRVQSLDGSNTEYNAGLMNEARTGVESAAHTYGGVGMSKGQYHIRRFGEKLRHLFVKSGELIRSISQRGRPRRTERAQDEWLADSLYSGV